MKEERLENGEQVIAAFPNGTNTTITMNSQYPWDQYDDVSVPVVFIDFFFIRRRMISTTVCFELLLFVCGERCFLICEKNEVLSIL
jgi:hypothetical protein